MSKDDSLLTTDNSLLTIHNSLILLRYPAEPLKAEQDDGFGWMDNCQHCRYRADNGTDYTNIRGASHPSTDDQAKPASQ